MCSERVPFSDEGPLLERLEFFEISLGSYQPSNFLPYLNLSMQFSTFILPLVIFFFNFSILIFNLLFLT